jgi:ADP-ribose pyrophosphatase YjhB (NUDIX family)
MSILDSFRHCPRCGAALASAARPLACACGYTLFSNPAIGVGVFARDGQGRCLFLRRAKDPAKGLLGLPGGFVDAGETVEGALEREVREEIGGRLASMRFLCSSPNSYLFQGVTYDVCDLFFVAELAPGELRLDPEEVSGHVWLDPRQVRPEEQAFPSHRQALAVLIR